MRNKSKIAIGALVAMSAAVANAGTYKSATSASVGVEGAAGGALTGLVAAEGLILTTGTTYNRADKLTLTLSGGATFQDASYVLLQSAGLDATEFTSAGYTKGDSSITFRAASDLTSAGIQFILSSSSAAAASVAVALPAGPAGTSIKVSGSVVDPADGLTYSSYAPTELFEYANEFAGAIDGDKLGNEIDVESPADREEFTQGTSDALSLSFTETNATYGAVLGDSDKVNITLKGDLSGVASITVTTGSVLRDTLTVGDGIAADYSFASVALSASDAFAATSTILNVVTGSGILSTGDFRVSAELDFAAAGAPNDSLISETAKNAGTWTINGLQAKVANMTLNSTGFISWLKVANEGSADAVIYADIIYNDYLGAAETKLTNKVLGTVKAGTVHTVSEADILTAIGATGTGVIDASITVTVTGPENSVFLTAEKKASDGRVNIPVFYDNTSGGRKWFQ